MVIANDIREEAKIAILEVQAGNVPAFTRRAERLVDQILSLEYTRFVEAAGKLGMHVETDNMAFSDFQVEINLMLRIPYAFCQSYYRDGPNSEQLRLHLLKLHESMKIVSGIAEYRDSLYRNSDTFAP